MSIAKYGFPENYNASWGVDTSQTSVDTGHILKSAWVLARVYLRHPDARYRTAARKLINEVLNNGGWDEAAGVPYTTGNWSTGQVTKLAECWQIEQAITGGLSNWYIADNQSDRDKFLKMADRSLQFFAKYVIDHDKRWHVQDEQPQRHSDRRREEQLLQRRVPLDARRSISRTCTAI